MTQKPQRGFTLIEVMITVAIVAILASIALPSYSAYVQRGRVPAALDALNSYYTRMEQRFQDGNPNSYANGTACGVALLSAPNFTFSCAISDSGQGFTATATGSGNMSGYTYSIDHLGVRRTVAHPRGTPSGNCWSVRGGSCDT